MVIVVVDQRELLKLPENKVIITHASGVHACSYSILYTTVNDGFSWVQESNVSMESLM